jgi:hypothetical protein
VTEVADSGAGVKDAEGGQPVPEAATSVTVADVKRSTGPQTKGVLRGRVSNARPSGERSEQVTHSMLDP